MKVIRFRDRVAIPKKFKAGVELDNIAEQIKFELPQFADGQHENFIWENDDYSNIEELEDGVLTVTNAMSQYPGLATCYITINVGETLMWHSELFYMDIISLPDTEERIVQEFPGALMTAVLRAEDAQDAAEDAQEAAEDAQAAAETAQAAAETAQGAAEASVTAAAGQATAAAASATAAAGSATAAAGSATDAATSATAAAGSATNAAASATAAAGSATDAAASATTAAGKASDAATSATAAAATAAQIVTEEAARQAAEAIRVTNEGSRQAAEEDREDAEDARETAETTRTNAESARMMAEAGRASAEGTRSANETARQAAETLRINAETDRETAEDARESASAAAVEAAEDAADAANAAAEAVSGQIQALQKQDEYIERCVNEGLMPYACNENNTNILTVEQDGNKLKINGTSNATASQGFTKVSLSYEIYSWNASTWPHGENYTIPFLSGHTYKLRADVISGTRDKGEGGGEINVRMKSEDGILAEITIGINGTTGEATYTAESDEMALVYMRISRLMTMTDVVVQIEIKDVTMDATIEELSEEIDGKQDELIFDTTPTADSTAPVTSGGIKTAMDQDGAKMAAYIENATGAKILTFQQGGIRLGNTGDTVTTTPDTSTSTLKKYGCAYAPIGQGQTVHTHMHDASASFRGWAFLDASNAIITKAASNNTGGELTLTAPIGSAYIVLNSSGYNSGDIWAIRLRGDQPWKGLYISLLGDSISALEGYIPSGNAPYYGPTRSTDYQKSITTPQQMWWYQLITALGGTPLIIDAWSGSSVTAGVEDGRTEMSNVSRCQRLHAYVETTSDDQDALEVVASDAGDGEVLLSDVRTSPFLDAYTPAAGDYVRAINPDIVIVTGGTNDWTDINTAEGIGTYDAHTTLANPDGDSPAVTTFREAYATMLCRIQSKYPFALTVCCKAFFMMRPNTYKYSGNKNSSSGLTIQDFFKAIEEIASIRACPVVSLWESGFNKYNYYETFAGDSSTTPTHPNALGQQMIATNAIPKFRETCSGYTAWLRQTRQA